VLLVFDLFSTSVNQLVYTPFVMFQSGLPGEPALANLFFLFVGPFFVFLYVSWDCWCEHIRPINGNITIVPR